MTAPEPRPLTKREIIERDEPLLTAHPLREWLRHGDHCPARRMRLDMTAVDGPCTCGLRSTLDAERAARETPADPMCLCGKPRSDHRDQQSREDHAFEAGPARETPADLTELPAPWERTQARVESMPLGPDRTQALVDMNAMLVAYRDALVAAGVRVTGAGLPFTETQPFYNAGYAAGARAVLEFLEAAVLALPNEDRDGYEDRWIARSGVTGLVEIARREYAALTADTLRGKDETR